MKLRPLASVPPPRYPAARLRRAAAAAGAAVTLGLGGCGAAEVPAARHEPPAEPAAAAADSDRPAHALPPEQVRRNEAEWLARAAEWRPGAEPTIGPREEQIRPAGVVIAPVRGDVRGALRQRLGEIGACYEAARQDDPDLEGQMTFELELQPDGTLSARVVEDQMGQPEMAACVVRVLTGLPMPGEGLEPGSVWRMPLVFARPPPAR